MAVDPKHTLGFLSGGYKNIAEFKGIDLDGIVDQSPQYSSLLVGWDAADWEVMLPILRKGGMPECATIMDGAIRANLATLDPPISPMLWTSIATSAWPSAHGIHGFTEVIDGSIRAVRGTSIALPTYFDILESEGIPATSIAWWPSHPAKKSDYGAFRVSNLAASEHTDWLLEGVSETQHVELLKSLMLSAEEVPPTAISSFFPGLELTGEDEVVRSVLKIVTHALNVHTLATYALEHGPGGHASVYYDALDHFKHLGMKYAPPKLESIDIEVFKKYNFIVEAAYRLHDLFLGSLLSYTNEDSHVLLVSDHGFKSGEQRPVALPNHAGAPALEHRHYGVFIAKGPLIEAVNPIGGLNLLDIAPIILAFHNLQGATHMRGKVPAGLLPTPLVKPARIFRASSFAENIDVPEGEMLQSLVDLGYLESMHVEQQGGRLLENVYYLARSLRCERRPARAWQVLRHLNITGTSPLRYQQLAASLLVDAGQIQELEKLVRQVNEPTNGLIWRYYEELINIKNGTPFIVPEELFDGVSVDEKVLWGNLLIRTKQFTQLERLLSKGYEGSVDLLNLRLRLAIERENWEQVLDDGLKSAALLYHQPWVQGALVVAFKNLGLIEESHTARRVQRKMLADSTSKPIFIVTGPPRSGTSLGMRLLEAAGIVPLTDKVRKRDEFNQLGYYEHEKIRNWDFTSDWLESNRGKSVKIVEPLLVRAPWPSGRKVIVRMNRPLPIVLRSQRNLKGQNEAPLGLSEMADWEKERRRTSTFLKMDPRVELVDLFYDDLIAAAETGKLNERLSMCLLVLSKYTETPVDISLVKAVVEPELRRF